MFGGCRGDRNCGHTTNWTCPCTCDEEYERDYSAPVLVMPKVQQPSEVERLKAQVEGMALYVMHGAGCHANDFDYLDKTHCTCGLRQFYNPKGCDGSSTLARTSAQ